MAAQNEASIRASSAPKVARNTARSQCSSADHQSCSNLSASASASIIASRASEVRSAKYNASAFRTRRPGRPVDRAACPIVFYCVLDPGNTFLGVTGSAAYPTARGMAPRASQYTKLCTPGEYISVQICALQPPVRLPIFLSNLQWQRYTQEPNLNALGPIQLNPLLPAIPAGAAHISYYPGAPVPAPCVLRLPPSAQTRLLPAARLVSANKLPD